MLSFQFGFRSPQRDRESDQTRLARVHQVVCSAVTDAESELNGLRGRLEKVRQSAIALVGTMENGDGEEGHKSKLKTIEERLLVAERRIVRLKDHIAALQRIESAVNLELKS
jgi:hypothetical protein